MNSNTLGNRAMLVSFNVSIWSARRVDKVVTDEIHKTHQASARAGRYNKCSIDPDDATFKAVSRTARAAREEHYRRTLPWTVKGQDILPSELYFDYVEKMGEFEAAFRGAVDEFVAAYPGLKSKAAKDLNGMYREGDYPAAQILPAKFKFGIGFAPLPDAADFRVSLGDAETDRVREEIERDVRDGITDAMKALMERFHTPIAHMAATLGGESTKWHETLVSNVSDIVDLLPGLNLTGDTVLDQLCREAKAKLLGHSAAALKSNPVTRSTVAAEAADIAQRMAAYMGA